MRAKSLFFSPQSVNLEINLPASKSESNRALIMNALSYSPYEVENLSDCDDTRVMLAVLDSNDITFDVGAAGTSMRFLTAFLAKTVGEWVITGSERMKNRPIKILVDALNTLGGKIVYLEKEGFPPLKIYGSAMIGGEISLDGSVSSQYISALMMIAPYMQNGLKITLVGEVVSMPYIRMTQKMMSEFGVDVAWQGRIIDIPPGSYHPIRYRVEADWSAASYWYELLTLVGEGRILLRGLKENSLQGDSQVAEIYKEFGIRTDYVDSGAVISRVKMSNKNIQPFVYDFIQVPDLAQSVVVTCCQMNRIFHFRGLQSLKIKETNRIEALINELRKLGFVLFQPAEGELAWNGERCEADKVPSIATYEDHRMAMSFAPLAIRMPLEVQNPEVVSKSYPGFWTDLEKLNTV